jgi:hypothetical protein
LRGIPPIGCHQPKVGETMIHWVGALCEV